MAATRQQAGTLGAALARYVVVLRGKNAPSTVVAYKGRLRILSTALGDEHTLRGIGLADLEAIQADYRSGRANNTVALAVSVWKGFFSWCVRVDLLRKNPAQFLDPPKRTEPDPRPLAEAIFITLRDLMTQEWTAADDLLTRRNAALVLFLVYTGLRRKEAAQASWPDIDWSERSLRVVGKGDKPRYVPLPRLIIPKLRQLQQDGGRDYGAIFAKEDGTHLNPYTLNAIFARWVVERLGQRLSPHVLRHTYATRMYDHGATYEEIGEALGHASIRTTKLYVRKRIDRLVAAADRLT